MMVTQYQIMLSASEPLKQTISESQHCQRNWDLTRTIPDADLDVFIHTVKEAPTKQNRVFYKVKFVTDRDLIQRAYETTNSFWNEYKEEKITNSQTLANLLVVFLEDKDHDRDHRTEDEWDQGKGKVGDYPIDPIDVAKAVGVCTGYLTLVANLLGYQTGNYDARHRKDEFNEILGGEVLHCLGIGYKDPDKEWNRHQVEDYNYTLYTKDVKTEIIK